MSETFTASATAGAGTFRASGDGLAVSASATRTTLTVAYDAASSSYTVVAGGRSQTFGPADLDAENSSAELAIYNKSSGTTKESLILTKPGAEGAFTYRYVGGGLWQRALDGSSSVTGTTEAFAYGVQTPDAALPRSGAASYSIDLVGVRTSADGFDATAGVGKFDVDFARGDFALEGLMLGVSEEFVEFVGEGRLSSSANSFAGTFRFSDGALQFTGSLDGRFFGPSTDELGGAWAVRAQGDAATSDVAVGVILGRKEHDLVSNGSFDAPANSEFFAGTGYRADEGALKASKAAMTIYFDADTGRYVLRASDASMFFDPAYTHYNGGAGGGQGGRTDEIFNRAVGGTSYVRAADWWRRVEGTGGSADIAATIRSAVYGYATPAAEVPRTGQADYAISLNGLVLYEGKPGEVDELFGSGLLTADFAGGTIALSSTARTVTYGGGVQTHTGSLSGSGTISSAGNAIAGTVDLSLLGMAPLRGDFAGGFFGPQAAEVGASFGLANGLGDTVTGSFMGPRGGGAIPLADFAAPAEFDSYVGFFKLPETGLGQVSVQSGRVSLTWDPAAGSYRLVNDTGPGIADPTFDLLFDASVENAAASGPAFAAYVIDNADGQWDARVYKIGNAELSLTYTSFVELQRAMDDPGADDLVHRNAYYVAFGSRTPSEGMPRSGSASYSGVLYGTGALNGTGTQVYRLSGTSALSADFGAGTLSTSLAVSGTDVADGSVTDFGTYTAAGQILGSIIRVTTDKFDVFGYFNGPAAAEYGATFTINDSVAAGTLNMTGVMIGKKD